MSAREVRSREQWAALADEMLVAVRPYASPHQALITLPGAPGGYGTAVDGLEGFARTFLLAGFRLAGERGADPLNLAEQYAAGLAAGTDPSSPERWVRPEEHGQAKVEAASLALILDMTRPWIWDALDGGVQERIVDYLSSVVGDRGYPRTNWLWFRVVVETFLRSVGGPWSAEDLEHDLALHESFVRADGWLSDGEGRSYDHYVGWALHLYPVLWARMQGTLADDDRRARDVARLDRYLQDAVRLVGADGSPLLQGRSLTYRFAAAAPFWAGAIAGVPSTPVGQLRRAASSIVTHFVQHGVPDDDGLLTLGWHGAWRPLVQSYSGPGSPYWAAKGMLGLALPADHPAWTTDEEPLPVEVADDLVAVAAPGWIVSGTHDDGVVRVVNHGTDHALEGSLGGDSPLYARLGYSTATAPLLDDEAWAEPFDQAVVLLDADGRSTHRSGMTLLECAASDGVGVAASRAVAHRLQVDPTAQAHGSGRVGAAEPVGTLTVVSVVRGAWEVRAVRVDDADEGLTLRSAGWPLSGEHELLPDGVRGDRLTSLLVADGATTQVRVDKDAGPLAPWTATPWACVPAVVGRWWVGAVCLAQHPSAPPVAVAAAEQLTVTWADGRVTTTALPIPQED
ncbi:DUF2264 domain-containing protein [Cellulomonas fengjieae]|uniref:DUF2264 domain-containing protein n=1 Tax=Cellulomonas fengjieae TaxID=2819978 RepID=A0ABS3SCR3_9CELL|nr:DUF2264 domain-containing protein [Cellulomonas fengjieae]MBO3083432.1 DUF2264 domain-containing protein [Cellulomonas fengjieae]QVI65235.1 DUF2264 domain-containing protein [Cellulomonas fengjieae]